MLKKGILLAAIFGFITSGLLMAEEGRQVVRPKKIEVDTNFDGQIDRIEHFDSEGKIESLELDNSGNGKMDEWIEYVNGKPVRGEKDTNGDGKRDVWIEY